MSSPTKSLDALLRYRTALERMQWLRLQSIHAEMEKAAVEVAKLERCRVESKLNLLGALKSGLTGKDIRTYSTTGLENTITERKKLLQQTRDRFQGERQEYLKRRQEREIVESAIARLQAEIVKEKEQKLQLQIDDETLQRFIRSGRKAH